MATVRASSRAALPFWRPAVAIVNISSVSGLRCSAPRPPDGAVKAAVIHYTISRAAMLAPKRIRVTRSRRDPSSFPAGSGSGQDRQPGALQRIRSSIPFGRMGPPEEIADVALFLASP